MKRIHKLGLRAIIAVSSALALSGCVTLEFSPDGKRLLFMWESAGNHLAFANADGSALRSIPGSNEGLNGHWNPSGTKVAFSGENGLCVYDLVAARTSVVLRGETLNSAWTSDREIVVYRENPRANENGKSQFVWIDSVSGAERKSIQLPALDEGERSFDLPLFITPIQRTDGVLFLYGANVWLAEFGGAVPLTKTQDVIGFAVAADGNRVVYARRTKNPQYYLMSIYELDVKLRTGRRIANLQNVPGINPKPRTGPKEILLAQFNNDFSEALVIANSDSAGSTAKTSNEIYVVKTDGSSARRILAATGPDDIATATFSPDGKSVAAIVGASGTIALATFDLKTGKRRTSLKTTFRKE